LIKKGKRKYLLAEYGGGSLEAGMKRIAPTGFPDRDCIGYWLDPSEWVKWQFRVRNPGKFNVTAEIASTGSGQFEVVVGSQRLQGKQAIRAWQSGAKNNESSAHILKTL
jgi:hypothetical protein